jgi:hypothetical protein
MKNVPQQIALTLVSFEKRFSKLTRVRKIIKVNYNIALKNGILLN